MLKSKLIILLLFLSTCTVLFLPVFTFFYLYPSMDKLMIENAEEQARRIANHLIEYFDVSENALQFDNVTYDLKDEIFEIADNFSLEKVKIFSSTGEIIFSTDPADIGVLNTKDYFNVLVMRGHNFSKLVKKDTQTLEGRKASRDIIESYIPIFGRDKVVGAFEIYFDLTKTRNLFSTLVHKTSILIFTISGVLLVSLIVSLVFLSRNMAARVAAEMELTKHRAELEELVKKRTTEVTAANIQLQEDISKRIETEKALQLSEQKFRSMVEMASDAIFIADAETGIILDVNKKGTELVGRDAQDLIGRHLSSLHPSDDDDLYRRLIESNYSLQLPLNKVLYVQHISGKKIPVDINANTIEFEKGRIVQGIFRDISQRLEFEDKLQKTEKFKTASVMAGGIAHDFNNLLTAVLGNISLAKLEAADNEKIKTRLVETEKAIGRARELTHQLLEFSKGSPPNKTVVKLGKLIKESAQFVLHGSKVNCNCAIPDDLWPAEVDEGQMSQVINNLVINASHAMDNGGTCSIKAENVHLDSACGLPIPSGKYVKIIVEDKGHGIHPKKLKKIFDPFYTTKEHGSGLGLSSAYTIVKNHGGDMTVDSEVDVGSVFSVYLPATNAELSEQNIQSQSETSIEGEGKILIMDDEDIVREAVVNLLDFLGYDADTAVDGQEALDLYELSLNIGHPYDAVIMDLTVPGGMGGKETVEILKKMDPSARVIVSSGYYTDPVLANFKEYGFDGVVPKPFQVEELGRVLKDVLSFSS